MPTATVTELSTKYGKYLDAGEAGGNFQAALNEVMPRIYQMGLWRDMADTVAGDTSAGSGALPGLTAIAYTLPDGYDSILAATLNDTPAVIYSMWHDFSLKTATSTKAGVFDDGYTGAANRAYRLAFSSDITKASFLLRRKYIPVSASVANLYVPNDDTVIKHGLLGKLAEDNADLQRSEYHWQTAQKLLDADIEAYMGGIRSKFHISSKTSPQTAPVQEQ